MAVFKIVDRYKFTYEDFGAEQDIKGQKFLFYNPFLNHKIIIFIKTLFHNIDKIKQNNFIKRRPQI